jgi:hypothetical protein
MPLETVTLTREDLCTVMQNVKVAVMMPCGRAGSVFFYGIFDQHKEVISSPIQYNAYDFYEQEDSFLSSEEYLDLFIDNNGDLFDLKWQYIEFTKHTDQKIKEIDKEHFQQLFFPLCRIYGDCGRKEYFLLFHFVLFLLRGGGGGG